MSGQYYTFRIGGGLVYALIPCFPNAYNKQEDIFMVGTEIQMHHVTEHNVARAKNFLVYEAWDFEPQSPPSPPISLTTGITTTMWRLWQVDHLCIHDTNRASPSTYPTNENLEIEQEPNKSSQRCTSELALLSPTKPNF